MRNSNITKLDSKGRILIPIHIRKQIEAANGTEMIIIPDNEKKQARILPLIKEKTAEFKLLMNDHPGSLASIASMLSEYDIDIIMSQSSTISKGRLAEWNVIADISRCNGNLKNLKNNLMASKFIRKVDILGG